MKGREASIDIMGQYEMNWIDYSVLDPSAHGIIKALIVHVHLNGLVADVRPQARDIAIAPLKDSPYWTIGDGSLPPTDLATKIQAIKDIPVSQFDLQDKLSQLLIEDGYKVQTNHPYGSYKLDISAEKGIDHIVIEVRYKTGLLQTMYNGKPINLKKHGAYLLSRYDFLKGRRETGESSGE
ncbi:MAG: hypothetical protein ACQEXQ_15525 [Bacillota bacterium]